ncbi:MAG: tol-pal system protein YbgF [Candidatus Zixiibacteriota bacterium]|nr:MAG: tol-pal system protein YbgF [candidate division Zixibacteria bacterium]
MSFRLLNEGGSRLRPGFPALCLGLLLAAGSLTGCASRGEILGFKRDMTYVRASVDTLNLHLQNLRLQADALQIRQDRLVEEMVTKSNQRQDRAYLSSRLDDLEAQAMMLSAQVNDLSQRLTGVAQRFDEMKYRTREPSAVDTTAAAEPVPPEPREVYDQAYLDLSRGNYDLARMGFEEYLSRYSDTELADNALYWLGEVEYVQHNYDAALQKFREVETRFPNGNKVAAALFKIGLIQIQMNQEAEARDTFTRLAQRYPGTPEAAQAQQKLKTLE